MALVKSKPTTPGRRHQVRVVHKHLHKSGPKRGFTQALPSRSGRNNVGRITVRHRGGGHKRKYRVIDFKRLKDSIEARVETIEYDPNRTAHIALLLYKDGERRYIIAPKRLAVGDTVVSGPDAPIKIGNCLPLHSIPYGTNVHCVELKPGRGAQMIRSAGTSAQLVSREGAYALLRLRSGEMRKVLVDCRACVGEVSNPENNLASLGKAGASRWRRRRPHVRGTAMNPIDHPHGGGEGKTRGRHPVSFTGVPTKGYKTRRNKRSNYAIVRDRRKK